MITRFCSSARRYFGCTSSIMFTLLAACMSHGSLLYSMTTSTRSSPNPAASSDSLCKRSNTKDGCRFKGVVPHKNGHWGAQIYANHQRIWLGTFKTEMEAARAYDRAAIKLRSDDSHRNVDSSPQEASLEAEFQRHRTKEEVISMIKDGSYQACFAEFTRSHHNHQGNNMENHKSVSTKLFEKKLTPSDVGKLNRLVIPKKCALKFYQRLVELGCSKEEDETTVDFLDKEHQRWEFRFCYWKSSQSFVFTRGWNKFVKGKKLKVDDVVVFYLCMAKDRPFFSIDVRNVTPMENLKVQDKGGNKGFRLFGMNITC